MSVPTRARGAAPPLPPADPPTVYVAAGRGVPGRTAFGAATVLCVLAAAVTGPAVGGLGVVFDVAFAVAAVGAALVVPPRLLRAAIVAPPLLYAGGALANGLINGVTGSGSWLLRQATNLAADLIVGAPVLVGVTLGVLLITTLRGRAAQRRRRRVSGSGRPGAGRAATRT